CSCPAPVEAGADRRGSPQVVAEHGVHVGKRDRRILLRDFLSRCALQEGSDQRVEGHSRPTYPYDPIRADFDRNCLGSRQVTHEHFPPLADFSAFFEFRGFAHTDPSSPHLSSVQRCCFLVLSSFPAVLVVFCWRTAAATAPDGRSISRARAATSRDAQHARARSAPFGGMPALITSRPLGKAGRRCPQS